MLFVSCLEIAKLPDNVYQPTNNSDNDDSCEYCICETYIQGTELPRTVADLETLVIDRIRLTGGDVIYSLENVTLSSLQLFSSMEDKSETRQGILYELLRFLTAHRVYIEPLQGKIEFTRWTIHIESNGAWKLVMELSLGALIGKLAQLDLKRVQRGEMDMFLLVRNLFDAHCRRGDELQDLTKRLQRVTEKVSLLEDERSTLDKVLEERDDRTRKMVVGLLNEKKKKIWELEKILREQHLDVKYPEYRSDEGLVNKYITDPVSELNSPGRRHVSSTLSTEGHLKKVKRKLEFENIPKLSEVSKTEENSDPSRGTFKELEYNIGNKENDGESSTDSELFVKVEEQENGEDSISYSSHPSTNKGEFGRSATPKTKYYSGDLYNSRPSNSETDSGEETEF